MHIPQHTDYSSKAKHQTLLQILISKNSTDDSVENGTPYKDIMDHIYNAVFLFQRQNYSKVASNWDFLYDITTLKRNFILYYGEMMIEGATLWHWL